MKNLSLALAAVALLTASGAYAQTTAVFSNGQIGGSCATANPVVIDSGYASGFGDRLFRPRSWFNSSAFGYGGVRTLTQSALVGGTNSLLLPGSPRAAFYQAGYHLPMIHVDAFRHRLLRLGPIIPSYMEKRI